MKKLTRRQAEKIIKGEYGGWYGQPIGLLCIEAPLKIRDDFINYWEEVDTGDCCTVFASMKNGEDDYPCPTEVAFLRLLTLHLFVRHIYE